MRTGKTLMELATEVTRIQKAAVDFRLPTSALKMTDTGSLVFGDEKVGQHEYGLNHWSNQQLASHVEIPKGYFDRLNSQNKALLADNVNHGLTIKSKEKDKSGRLIRVLDGKVRGYLSTSYRTMDSHDVLEAMLPTLLDNEFEVVSSEITEKRLYLKTTSPKIQGEIKKGDVVQYGVMITTSDVGAGQLNIEPYINRLVCENGAVMSSTFKKAHLGRNQFSGYIEQVMSDKTRSLNDAAFYATLQDYLKSTMKPEVFKQQIELMKNAAERYIEKTDLEEVIEISMKTVGQSAEHVKKGVLHALASGNEGAGLTQWGLANSFTAYAKNDNLTYDEVTDLERAGGQILELNQTQWKRIAG